MSNVDCVACHRAIDDAAKICPYCGAEPRTGEKNADTATMLQEEFTPRRLTKSESLLEYARQRQGVIVAVSIIVAFVILTAVHQYVTMRNQTAVSAAPAVPLTDVTDLSNQPDESKPQPMPDLQFEYVGRPQSMRNYIVEAGAMPPPEVVAQQQAAAQAAAAKQQAAAAAGQRPGVSPPAAQPRPPTAPAPATTPTVTPQPPPARPPV